MIFLAKPVAIHVIISTYAEGKVKQFGKTPRFVRTDGRSAAAGVSTRAGRRRRPRQFRRTETRVPVLDPVKLPWIDLLLTSLFTPQAQLLQFQAVPSRAPRNRRRAPYQDVNQSSQRNQYE